jgi:hypothetical protein
MRLLLVTDKARSLHARILETIVADASQQISMRASSQSDLPELAHTPQ